MVCKSALGSVEDKIVARLVKNYIMTHQGCTSKQISQFLLMNDFGLKADYTALNIARLIKYFLTCKGYDWFKVIRVEKKNARNVYFI